MRVIHALDRDGQPVSIGPAAGRSHPGTLAQIGALGWTVTGETPWPAPGTIPGRVITLPELALLRPPSEQSAGMYYRWRGTDHNGEARHGSSNWPDLDRAVRTLYGLGWTRLTVCSGPGPVPPPAAGPADVVATIGPHLGTGDRTWWVKPRAEAAL